MQIIPKVLFLAAVTLACSPDQPRTAATCPLKGAAECLDVYSAEEQLAARAEYLDRFNGFYREFLLASLRQATIKAIHSEIASATFIYRVIDSVAATPCADESRLSEAAIVRVERKQEYTESAGQALALRIDRGCYRRGDAEVEWHFDRSERRLRSYEEALALSDTWLKKLCGCYGVKVDIVGDDGTVLFTSERHL